jgi:hypothetical protein
MRFVVHRALAPLAVAALLVGCSSRGSITAPFVLGADQAFVLTTDFSTGGLSVIDLDTRRVAVNVAAVHSDATLRVHDGLIYVVNRFGQDNIQIIDPARKYATLRQYSTGNGSNPQDIVFASALKAYISRYGCAEVLVVDPRSGLQRNTISLAAFADGDGLPEMARMALVGSHLFVACQRLTNFAAVNTSVVVVIDVRTDAIVDVDPGTPGVQAITLTGRNPVTDLVYDDASHSLLVGCAGIYGALDGGIERIDVVTLQDLGVVISEATLGGDIGDIAWNGPNHSYAIVSDASFDASVVAWSATTGAKLGTVYAPGGFSLPDCAVNDRGELYVCDNRFTAPGVRVFRAGADTLLAGPLDTGLPPSQIAFR